MVFAEAPAAATHAAAAPDPLSGLDAASVVTTEPGRILRGVCSDKVDEVRAIIDSGLLRALIEARLFPPTRESEIALPGFGLVLEHHRVHPLALAGEWSFEMLRDAALALIAVNRIARRFGYETRDANLYNLCFAGTEPVYFDLGSFVPRAGPATGWRAYDEFVRSVLYPLKLAAQAGSGLLRMLLDFELEHEIGEEDYVRLRLGGLAGILPAGLLASALKARPTGQALLARLKGGGSAQSPSAALFRLERQVLRMRGPRPSRRRLAPPRHDPIDPAVQRILGELRPPRLLVLGGGDGALALAAMQQGLAQRVVSADRSAASVDAAYLLFKRHGGGRCLAVMLDILEEARSIRLPPVTERYGSDAVLALDLVDHLLLHRGVRPGLLLDRIGAFASGHVIVECGLPHIGNRPPERGLSRDRFRAEFAARFELIGEHEPRPGRLLLVGRKR